MVEKIKKRLEYLRGEIRKECISFGEILELQSLKEHIEKGDVELLQWAEDQSEEAKEIKDSYENKVCPDCKIDIPNNVVSGEACVNCGHVFYVEIKEEVE